MKPHVVQSGDITSDDFAIFHDVCKYVRGLPDGYDCHQVCGFVEKYVNTSLVKHTGYFARKGWDHSWLTIRDRPVIIDAYPWCCGSGPIMVYTGGTLNPWRDLYVEDDREVK